MTTQKYFIKGWDCTPIAFAAIFDTLLNAREHAKMIVREHKSDGPVSIHIYHPYDYRHGECVEHDIANSQ